VLQGGACCCSCDGDGGHLLVDIVYGIINPRIRHQK